MQETVRFILILFFNGKTRTQEQRPGLVSFMAGREKATRKPGGFFTVCHGIGRGGKRGW